MNLRRDISKSLLWTVAAIAVVITVIFIAARFTTQNVREHAQPAPDFEVRMYQGQADVGGQQVRLSQILARGKPVVLNFFAGLCPPCRAEMPDFQERYAAGGRDRYVMLAVDVGPYTALGTREDGKRLLGTLGITFPAGTVFDEDILAAYQLFGMPSTFFITPRGRIVRKQAGLLTPGQMDAYIRELLEASALR
ncbi:MAG TPA: TlpA disulfide reductase family protein [bacterium]|nr:TlpA disulfide reductase family protein [bacterium]